MPRKTKNERVAGQFFRWLLGSRAGVFYADGRSNPRDAGRHSLATRDRTEALRRLARLDATKAVEFGLAPASLLTAEAGDLLPLEEGRHLYLRHVRRPPVLGGAEPRTAARYEAVLDKFIPFCQREGVQHWQAVTKPVVEAYGAWLDDQGYAYATEYLELTTVKQVLRWLADTKKIPAGCALTLPLPKPRGTTTYCYRPEEVDAILAYCAGCADLAWLAQVVLALTRTGLRIGELAQLRWGDFDFTANMLRLTDTRRQAPKPKRGSARATKSHRDRVLPIQAELRQVLEGMERHADGRVFHGPRGGVLKPDTVRTVLVREVLAPLAAKFPSAAGEKGFADGRLHSFRHFFCSACAQSNVPEQTVMDWLGHQDSKMVRRYYHLHRREAQRQMAQVRFAPPAEPVPATPPDGR
jgi:integrase